MESSLRCAYAQSKWAAEREALCHGAPIACSNVGVMPEIGGEAVVYFDLCDVEDIARVLTRLMTDEDLRQRLRAAARERASAFPDGAGVAGDTISRLEAAGRGSAPAAPSRPD